MKPLVLILTLGGTIAMTQDDANADTADTTHPEPGVKPRLTGEMLVAAVPQLAEAARIEVCSFRQVPGVYLRFDDIEAVADAILEAVLDGASGVVVVQGTDTIEETAFALDRLLDLDAPVVVTGAMRNPMALSADGPANLMSAVQVAASDAARGLGCVVVMNDEVHAARFVRKTHTSNPAAFTSPNAGPLGWIVEGRVRIVTRVLPTPCVERVTVASITLGESPSQSDAQVVLLTTGLGDDGTAVDLVREGIDGMVIDATGGGHVSIATADALERAARRIPVILASRSLAGETLSKTYGFVGSEIDLQRRGLIRAGWLDGVKARVLLTLLLRRGHTEPARIGKAFEVWGGGMAADEL